MLGIGSTTLGGMVVPTGVYIGSTYFQGAFGNVQHSESTAEYIYCFDYSDLAFCGVRDRYWEHLSCVTTDTSHLAAIRSLSDSDFLRIYHDGGACTSIHVGKRSYDMGR